MSNIVLKGSTSGDVTITVPAAAGTNTVTIPAATGNLPLSNLTHVTNRPNAKPFIINGNFAVAQRGTSADGTSAYLIDRWKKQAATTGNVAVSQDTDAPTGFINSQKILASGASSFFQTGQQIEYKNFYPLLGKAASLSFYYKSDVDVIIRIRTGTGTADTVVLFTGGVASTATVSPSADWVQYVHNFSVATNVTSLSIEFATGTLANTDFVFLAGVQLEQGTYDTTTIPPFQHESFGDSLQRCQRYFQNIEAARTNASGFGQVESSTVHIQLPLAVTPRILAQYQGSGTFTKVGTIAVNAFPTNGDNITGVSFWVVMGNSVIVGMTTSGSTTNGAAEPVRYGSATPQTIFTLDTEL
tara:strand:- start:3360 stop:4430 length:1071 start_codon:yes stop_codon:yes gene_type:complete